MWSSAGRWVTRLFRRVWWLPLLVAAALLPGAVPARWHLGDAGVRARELLTGGALVLFAAFFVVMAARGRLSAT